MNITSNVRVDMVNQTPFWEYKPQDRVIIYDRSYLKLNFPYVQFFPRVLHSQFSGNYIVSMHVKMSKEPFASGVHRQPLYLPHVNLSSGEACLRLGLESSMITKAENTDDAAILAIKHFWNSNFDIHHWDSRWSPSLFDSWKNDGEIPWNI